MQRILDDCHIFSNMLNWKEGYAFFTEEIPVVEKAFQDLLSRIEDPFYEQDLLIKLAQGTTPAQMQQIIYKIHNQLMFGQLRRS